MDCPKLPSPVASDRKSRMPVDSSETNRVLEQAARGDGQAMGALLARHRDRLRRMVALRLDRRL
jgi:RNA polymerase sigma-70 factor (ECF subfamily)